MKRIAIITGGESAERDISIKSAENVRKNIVFADTELFTFPEEREKFIAWHKDFDIVIPMIHGAGGEDGVLQTILESLGVPYIFSGPGAHSIGIDKKKAKEVAESIGIKSPEACEKFPLFMKPRFGGSSVASKVCNSKEELGVVLGENSGVEFVKEEIIHGREFTVGIIEHDGEVLALPVLEIIPKGGFFDYESKYESSKLAEEICPADIDAGLEAELKSQALLIHQKIGAKHISRSDFIVSSNGGIYFLEINTIPGMTETSLIPKMLKTVGISLSTLLKEWCKINT